MLLGGREVTIATLVLALVALVTASAALIAAIRAGRRLEANRADLESISAALDQERHATAESIAAAHGRTVDEVGTLIENLLTQIDTETTARVAEALAHLNTAQTEG